MLVAMAKSLYQELPVLWQVVCFGACREPQERYHIGLATGQV